MARKTYIHVNQHIIKANNSAGPEEPQAPLTVKDYKQNRKAFEAIIRDDRGVEVARVVYRPDAPLDCGARVWIETRNPVDVLATREDVELDELQALLAPVGGL